MPKIEDFAFGEGIKLHKYWCCGVAEHCKLLRKLHIDGWRSNRIGDEGLMPLLRIPVNL